MICFAFIPLEAGRGLTATATLNYYFFSLHYLKYTLHSSDRDF
jgi:hypothetical protein